MTIMENLTKCLKNFISEEGIDGHQELAIEIPSGFFRYHRVEKYSDVQWTPIKIKFVCHHKTLRFTVLLSERGARSLPKLKRTRTGGIGKRENWIFAQPIMLSLPQAKKLVRFLQNHFGGHDFSLRNKLS